jgi:hypothetical protein
MATPPFRPARDIAITARRTACNDPANYDSTPPALSTIDGAEPATPHGDILDAHPVRPRWWPSFTTTMAGIAAAGAVLFLADQHAVGTAITAASALAWGLARVAAFYDNDLP